MTTKMKGKARLEALINIFKDSNLQKPLSLETFVKHVNNARSIDDVGFYNYIEILLKEFLLSPKSLTEDQNVVCEDVTPIGEEELRTILVENVPGVEEMMDRTGAYPVLKFISSTYQSGLPLFKSNEAVQQHTVKAIRFLFHKAPILPEKSKQHIFKRLAEAYTSCQMEQGRVIDSLYGSLSGRDKSFKEQVLSIADIQKEQVLNQTVNHFNPNAWRKSDDYPEEQIPHIQSSYCAAIGPQFGLRGVKAAKLDTYCMDLEPQKIQDIATFFKDTFSVSDLISTLINDINQQSTDAERLINRESLTKWAGNQKENNLFSSHSIFYSEDNRQSYQGAPTEENKYEPFLNRSVALDILFHLFLIDKI